MVEDRLLVAGLVLPKRLDLVLGLRIFHHQDLELTEPTLLRLYFKTVSFVVGMLLNVSYSAKVLVYYRDKRVFNAESGDSALNTQLI
jgi:hypothetical protein